MHPFTQFVNPHLGKLLSSINMDKRFVRGEGCYLYDETGRRYLDAVAAYGALPFGFNPPEIWSAVTAVRDTLEPSFVQPSHLEAAGELARRLVELVPGMAYVTFANSGAEAVEAALKLARSRTGRRGIISTTNSFHGKTLAALSATNRTAYQAPFFAPIEGFARIPFGDTAALEKVFTDHPGEFAALIVEPIQGEGGIIEAPAGYLAEAKRICQAHGALLILDEVQTGLGRTGKLFAHQGVVQPDILVLAKALGGGLVPIGAMLATADAYTEEFALKHSSTFAGNTLACRVGIAALDLLTRDDQALVRQVAENGAFLKAGLQALAAQYPRLVRAVRGQGYMLGIDFCVDRDTFPGTFLGVMAEQENLTPVITSYLLNIEGVRVAPTLTGASVVRIEPPLIMTRQQCQDVLDAVGRMLAKLSTGNTAEFVRHLIGVEERPLSAPLPQRQPLPKPPADSPGLGRFAFLMHPVNLNNYAEFDSSFGIFNDEEMKALVSRFNDELRPFVCGAGYITSATGQKVFGEFIAVPRTADELLAMPHEQAVAEVRAAVELARDRGAKLVGLGAYTSVVTRGGTHLKDTGVALTTGNSFTVVAAVDAVLAAAQGLQIRLEDLALAVVGATGAIGRGVAMLLAERLPRLMLIGNPARPDQARRRMVRIAGEIVRYLAGRLQEGARFAPGTLGAAVEALPNLPDPGADAELFRELAEQLEQAGYIIIGTDADTLLPQADVVVCATSSVDAIVTPDNVRDGAIVCDLSRPPNVGYEMRDKRPDVLVIDGGIIEVPGRPDFGLDFGFETGLVYACMAETILLALEQDYQDYSLGADLPLETIVHLRALGQKHGLKLAQLRSFDRPLSRERWEELLAYRARRRLGEARMAGDD
jgi:acetylornithine/succinyldiaminopimelate/putrescine aminotransferase/predicted amino acid dehydrogenase